ncbi:MAG: YggS family pyridoxal phosphate-dependent enzyme [Flavobacteriales bacterium]|nr:YggS family pyridoxal phosphate-dependent enzyme [Flavobacteriales bacterium]
MPSIKKNLDRILGDLPEGVTLVAVSKTKPVEMIQEAYDAGQRHFGENRPQEMKQKYAELPEDIYWHMIGHLQTNKVKYIIDFVYLIHSVDRMDLLEEIEKRAARIGRKVDVLLQVHIAQEEQKFGFQKEEILDLIRKNELDRFQHVNIMGLMAMATFTEDMDQVRSEFRELKNLFDSMLELNKDKILEMRIISMGMSGDFQVAIEEGSNMVRIGSSIFGARK